MSGWGAGYPGVPSDVAKKARQTATQDRDRPSAHTSETGAATDAAPETGHKDRASR